MLTEALLKTRLAAHDDGPVSQPNFEWSVLACACTIHRRKPLTNPFSHPFIFEWL